MRDMLASDPQKRFSQLEPAGTAADPVTATPATATEAAPAPGRAPSRKHALHTGSEPLAPPAYVALGERLRREAGNG